MKVTIERCNRTEGGGYVAYNTDCDIASIIGYGDTISETKDDFFNSLHEVVETYEGIEAVPAELSEPVEFHFSLTSLFDAFPWLNVSKVAEALGLNKSLLHQYKSGKAYVSDERLAAIEAGLRDLGAQLASLRL